MTLAVPVGAQASQPPLKLVLPNTEQVGEPVAITAVGNSDGSPRLFLFADEQRRPCAASPSAEQSGSWELTPHGGETLPAGEFSRSYSYTPQIQIAELCAYLDVSATGVPTATATTPDPTREYLENETEATPTGESTSELPGAIKPLPVNVQLMNEYWARIDREQRERESVHTAVPPCRVPRLRGHTLQGARRVLRAAGCALGRVQRRGARGQVVVLAQRVAAGRVLEGGSTVAIVLGSARR